MGRRDLGWVWNGGGAGGATGFGGGATGAFKSSANGAGGRPLSLDGGRRRRKRRNRGERASVSHLRSLSRRSGSRPALREQFAQLPLQVAHTIHDCGHLRAQLTRG